MSEEILSRFFNLLERIEHTVRMAKRHKISLVGAQPYGRKFRSQAAEIIKQFSVLRASLDSLDHSSLSPKLIQIQSLVDKITALDNAKDDKLGTIEQLKFVWKSEIEGILEQLGRTPRPYVDLLIPKNVVEGQPKWIERIAYQVNGCYNDGYYDACAVMIRRLLETLIIECYERKGIGDRIKSSTNEYIGFADLVGKVINEPMINLSRVSKNGLPKLKDLGHTGAHTRRVILRKSDIEKHSHAIRVAVEELISNLT